MDGGDDVGAMMEKRLKIGPTMDVVAPPAGANGRRGAGRADAATCATRATHARDIVGVCEAVA